MAQKADRYTLLKVHFNDLPGKIKSIHELGFQWFCVRCNDEKQTAELYVFFDKAGMNNYLSGIYDQVADNLRALVDECIADENVVTGDVLKQMQELLDY